MQLFNAPLSSTMANTKEPLRFCASALSANAVSFTMVSLGPYQSRMNPLMPRPRASVTWLATCVGLLEV